MTTEATATAPATTTETPATPAPEKKLSPLEKASAAFDKVVADAKAAREKAAAAAPAEGEPAPKPTEPPPTETPKPVTPKPEEPLSAKFAQVAKLERKAREEVKAAKAEREAVAKERAEWKARLDAAETKKANAKANPIAYLEEAGLSYEDVTSFQLNGGKPTAELQVGQLRDELARGQKEQEKAREESARKERDALLAQQKAQFDAWVGGVVDFVKANASTYELINQQGAHQLVPTVMKQAWDREQRVLSETEAADLVEKHLEEQAEALLKTSKLQARLKPQPAVQPAVAAQPRTTTLSNGLTASASSSTNGAKPRTAAEKMERARLAMENAQKS